MSNQSQSTPSHHPETFSTSILQEFDDGKGLPLDDPVVQERERARKSNAADASKFSDDAKADD